MTAGDLQSWTLVDGRGLSGFAFAPLLAGGHRPPLQPLRNRGIQEFAGEEFLRPRATFRTKLLRILKGKNRANTSAQPTFLQEKIMRNLELGDFVRVVGLPCSELQGLRGQVAKIVDPSNDGQPSHREFAVEFPVKGRRWLLASHLVRSVPERWIRFFRYEVLDRWDQLNPDDVWSLQGDYDAVVQLLQDRYDFSNRRAQAEVDGFSKEFEARIVSATASPARSADKKTAYTAA